MREHCSYYGSDCDHACAEQCDVALTDLVDDKSEERRHDHHRESKEGVEHICQSRVAQYILRIVRSDHSSSTVDCCAECYKAEDHPPVLVAENCFKHLHKGNLRLCAYGLCDLVGIDFFFAHGYTDHGQDHAEECDTSGYDDPCSLVAAKCGNNCEHESGKNELHDELSGVSPNIEDSALTLISGQVGRKRNDGQLVNRCDHCVCQVVAHEDVYILCAGPDVRDSEQAHDADQTEDTHSENPGTADAHLGSGLVDHVAEDDI